MTSNSYIWANPDKTVVRREADNGMISDVPVNPANTDYQAFLRWCDEGNTPEPYVPEPEPAPALLTPAEKLAASGLTVEELKGLLGL